MLNKINELKLDWDSTPVNGGAHRTAFDMVFSPHSHYTHRDIIKRMLIKHDIIRDNCAVCGLSDWMGNSIVLHLDHIDGDRHNNQIHNLRLLCPNCHSQTHTFGGKNVVKPTHRKRSDDEFIQSIKSSINAREALIKLGLQAFGGNYDRVRRVKESNKIDFTSDTSMVSCEKKSNRPSYDILLSLLCTKPIVEIGELYDVSDNAVRKWMRIYGIPTQKTKIKAFLESSGLIYEVKVRAVYNPMRGSLRSDSILSESDIVKIRKEYLLGRSQRDIAKSFNVSRSTIAAILSNRSWTHVVDDNCVTN